MFLCTLRFREFYKANDIKGTCVIFFFCFIIYFDLGDKKSGPILDVVVVKCLVVHHLLAVVADVDAMVW